MCFCGVLLLLLSTIANFTPNFLREPQPCAVLAIIYTVAGVELLRRRLSAYYLLWVAAGMSAIFTILNASFTPMPIWGTGFGIAIAIEVTNDRVHLRRRSSAKDSASRNLVP